MPSKSPQARPLAAPLGERDRRDGVDEVALATRRRLPRLDRGHVDVLLREPVGQRRHDVAEAVDPDDVGVLELERLAHDAQHRE